MTSAVVLALLRPAKASRHPIIAETERRVVHFELDKRLPGCKLVLRQVGESIGPWRSFDGGPWPGDRAVAIADDVLWHDDEPPLTALFGRTIDPVSTDVRSRMLHFLGLLGDHASTFDDQRLEDLLKLSITPTDLWLVVGQARQVTVSDRAVEALRGVPEEQAWLDQVFDEIARSVDVS